MLRATILRIDGSRLLSHIEIQTNSSKRGSGDGNVWRGLFAIPAMQLRPTLGESLILVMDDERRVSAVVTAVQGPQIHFRAWGRAPAQEATEARTESA